MILHKLSISIQKQALKDWEGPGLFAIGEYY